MNRQETIQKYLGDMLVLERHILEAIGRQRNDETVREHPEVNELVIRMERMLKSHVAALEAYDLAPSVGRESIIKKAVGGAFGVAAGLYDRMRSQELSRILRDNYTALNLAAISYAMMHTMALAVSEENVAQLAKRHLEQIPPILDGIRLAIPQIVADEIAHHDGFSVVSNAGSTAVENLADVWHARDTATL